jgi:hypothetical protein
LPSTLTPNKLNNYFTSVGENLAKQFNKDPPVWKLPSSVHQFKFSEISEEYIFVELKSLKNTSNQDVCKLDTKLLKLSADIITPSLHYLFNESVELGYFPEEWKLAKVTPTFKSERGELVAASQNR